MSVTAVQANNLATSANNLAASAVTKADTAQATADSNTSAIATLTAAVASIPAGAQGVQGDKGDAFTFGDFTSSQLDSLKGLPGDTGAIGSQGIAGIAGTVGDIGPAGVQGAVGASGAAGPQGNSAFSTWKTVKGYSSSKTEADFIEDLKGDPAEIADVTKKKTKLSNKIKLPRKKINESKYIPIKDIKGNIKAVSVPHDIIVGTTQTKSDIFLNGDLIADGNIQLSGEIGKFSDARLKSNIVDLERAQDIIECITPVTFEWNESGKRESGFIAQNIKDTYPELILKDEKSDMLKLKTTSLAWNAIIIGAIKEQQATIKAQQSQIDELKKLVLELTKNNI